MRLILGALLLLAVLAGLVLVVGRGQGSGVVLELYVDRTLMPVLERALPLILEELRARGYGNVEFVYVQGSSGKVLSELKISGRGDIYATDGWQFMDVAVEEGLVLGDTVTVIGYLALAIYTAKGNPHDITGIEDLASRRGLSIALGSPDHVIAGIISKSILESLGLWDKLLEGNRVVYAQSAAEAAYLVATGAVDASISFEIFYYAGLSRETDIIPIGLEQARAPIIIAIASSADDVEAAKAVIEVLSGEEVKPILRDLGVETPP